jgi:hypothetical protein
LSDITTLKSDTAGSVAVTTTGDRIGRILDKSGGSNTLIAPNNNNRMTYRTGIQNSLSAAAIYEDAGIDTLLTVATVDTTDLTFVAVFRTPGTIAGATQYGIISAYHSTNGGSRIMIESGASKLAGQTSPTTATVLSASAATTTTNYIVSYQVATTPRRRLTVNNVASTVDTTALTAPVSTVSVGTSHTNNGNSPWTGGHLMELVAYHPTISDNDTRAVVNYLNRKWSVF